MILPTSGPVSSSTISDPYKLRSCPWLHEDYDSKIILSLYLPFLRSIDSFLRPNVDCCLSSSKQQRYSQPSFFLWRPVWSDSLRLPLVSLRVNDSQDLRDDSILFLFLIIDLPFDFFGWLLFVITETTMIFTAISFPYVSICSCYVYPWFIA